MGEGECEPVEVSKRGRHRKKQLYNSILHQMEFYFSDSNLRKDRFLSQLLKRDPYIDLKVFLSFNKIRKLNCTPDDICKAISKSELIELSEDKEKIRRKVPIKVKENEDDCTVYVENIKADDNHESLSHIFSDFGNVVYVSVPKYRHTKNNKGFAFVEFETEKEAQNALSYFESIGCKMPLETNPEDLVSIKTFEDDNNSQTKNSQNKTSNDMDVSNNVPKVDTEENKNKSDTDMDVPNEEPKVETGENKSNNDDTAVSNEEPKVEIEETTSNEENAKKRKLSEEYENQDKKIKLEPKGETTDPNENSEKVIVDKEENTNEKQEKSMEVEDAEIKKKKKHKKDKKKAHIKELGIQILSKKEWKKLRNRYLDLQKKKMKEFKQYLHRERFSSNNYQKTKQEGNNQEENTLAQTTESTLNIPKLQFIPGVIVKLTLAEPCEDYKKLKNDLKSAYPTINYVDITIGSSEALIRFSSNEGAKEFCSKDYPGAKVILEGDEENDYWERIQNDRTLKFNKNANKRKQRGRDKLLKKAQKEQSKHIKFDENE